MRATRIVAMAVLPSLACGAIALGTARQEQPQQPTRAEYMRAKLGLAKDLVEGLTLEDFAKLDSAARRLKRLSQGAEWDVPVMRRFAEYVPLSEEFRRLCDELTEAARARNLDGATLAYLRLTTNCVDCHKRVRRVAQ
jgi:hypothetical protein